MKSKIRHVGALQMTMTQDPAENLERARSHVLRAGQDGFDLLVLPELFSFPYFCQTEDHTRFDLAEDVNGHTITTMREAAKTAKLVLVCPYFERVVPVGMYFNSSVIIECDGRLVGHYRKTHIPEDPGFHEKYYFTQSCSGFPVFETSIGRVGILICWDQWFPEAARILALQGADIVVVPTAIGDYKDSTVIEKSIGAWQGVQRGHAIANNLFWVTANRIGFEPKPGSPEEGLVFWGRSFMVDPWGTILNDAGTLEGIIGATCDLAQVEEARRQWPFLRDRRGDRYAGLCSPVAFEDRR